jgi:hypothetical protein
MLVVIESPWAGLGADKVESLADMERCQAFIYLRACIRDSLSRGEIPWASHAMLALTRALYEEDPDQRQEGIDLNKQLIKSEAIKLVVLYEDFGISRGMKEALIWSRIHGKPVEFRTIYLKR